jgi:hypothetical protein
MTCTHSDHDFTYPNGKKGKAVPIPLACHNCADMPMSRAVLASADHIKLANRVIAYHETDKLPRDCAACNAYARELVPYDPYPVNPVFQVPDDRNGDGTRHISLADFRLEVQAEHDEHITQGKKRVNDCTLCRRSGR